MPAGLSDASRRAGSPISTSCRAGARSRAGKRGCRRAITRRCSAWGPPTRPWSCTSPMARARCSSNRVRSALRTAPAFVTAMPKSYMDNLPSRAAKYKDREVPPRATGDLAYADVELYLKAPPEIRRAVMQRFISKAHDPAFRQALVANLRFHPEWDPILFPEKYKPKPPPDPPAAAPATGTAKV